MNMFGDEAIKIHRQRRIDVVKAIKLISCSRNCLILSQKYCLQRNDRLLDLEIGNKILSSSN